MGPGWVQILLVLLVVLLLFGTKRIRNIGSDLGAAIKGFRKGMSGEEEAAQGKLGQDTTENAKAERSAEAERKDG